MKKSEHKLSKTLQTMTKEDLKEVYGLMWKDGDKYTEEDLRAHIAKYIILFYKCASLKPECKDKASYLLNELKYRWDEYQEEKKTC